MGLSFGQILCIGILGTISLRDKESHWSKRPWHSLDPSLRSEELVVNVELVCDKEN